MCVMDLVKRFKMTMLESLLITFKVRFIFEAAGAVVRIGSNLKLYHHKQI